MVNPSRRTGPIRKGGGQQLVKELPPAPVASKLPVKKEFGQKELPPAPVTSKVPVKKESGQPRKDLVTPRKPAVNKNTSDNLVKKGQQVTTTDFPSRSSVPSVAPWFEQSFLFKMFKDEYTLSEILDTLPQEHEKVVLCGDIGNIITDENKQACLNSILLTLNYLGFDHVPPLILSHPAFCHFTPDDVIPKPLRNDVEINQFESSAKHLRDKRRKYHNRYGDVPVPKKPPTFSRLCEEYKKCSTNVPKPSNIYSFQEGRTTCRNVDTCMDAKCPHWHSDERDESLKYVEQYLDCASDDDDSYYSDDSYY